MKLNAPTAFLTLAALTFPSTGCTEGDAPKPVAEPPRKVEKLELHEPKLISVDLPFAAETVHARPGDVVKIDTATFPFNRYTLESHLKVEISGDNFCLDYLTETELPQYDGYIKKAGIFLVRGKGSVDVTLFVVDSEGVQVKNTRGSLDVRVE